MDLPPPRPRSSLDAGAAPRSQAASVAAVSHRRHSFNLGPGGRPACSGDDTASSGTVRRVPWMPQLVEGVPSQVSAFAMTAQQAAAASSQASFSAPQQLDLLGTSLGCGPLSPQGTGSSDLSSSMHVSPPGSFTAGHAPSMAPVLSAVDASWAPLPPANGGASPCLPLAAEHLPSSRRTSLDALAAASRRASLDMLAHGGVDRFSAAPALDVAFSRPSLDCFNGRPSIDAGASCFARPALDSYTRASLDAGAFVPSPSALDAYRRASMDQASAAAAQQALMAASAAGVGDVDLLSAVESELSALLALRQQLSAARARAAAAGGPAAAACDAASSMYNDTLGAALAVKSALTASMDAQLPVSAPCMLASQPQSLALAPAGGLPMELQAKLAQLAEVQERQMQLTQELVTLYPIASSGYVQ